LHHRRAAVAGFWFVRLSFVSRRLFYGVLVRANDKTPMR